MKNFVPYLFFATALTVSIQVSAQVRVTGTVKSAGGEPLVGAGILVKNTSVGTIADVNGAFSLQLDDNLKNSTLVISFIGYISQEAAIGERTTFDITLGEDATQLNEIVVTGYSVEERGKRS